MWIEKHNRGRRTHRSADPVGTVDHEIDATTHAGRDQLVDRGIDRCVFAADARASEHTEERIAGEVPGERGQRCCREINGNGNEKQFLPPEPIRSITEDQRTDYRANQIEGRTRADLRIRQAEGFAMSENRAKRASERYLQPIETPSRPQRADDEPMPSAPPPPAQPGGDVG